MMLTKKRFHLLLAGLVLTYGHTVAATLPTDTNPLLQSEVEVILEAYAELSGSLMDAIDDGLLDEETWNEQARYELLSYYYNEHEQALAKIK